MNGYGRITRLVLMAMAVILGAMYLGADYFGADVTPEAEQWGMLAQLLVAMMLAAIVLLGVIKLVGKLWDLIVERQSRDDDDSSSSE